jgi:hypothetical protein
MFVLNVIPVVKTPRASRVRNEILLLSEYTSEECHNSPIERDLMKTSSVLRGQAET